jgi:hypothetical protein
MVAAPVGILVSDSLGVDLGRGVDMILQNASNMYLMTMINVD